MGSSFKGYLKDLLGGIPAAAELSQAWIYQDRPPSSGYPLDRLADMVPDWVADAEQGGSTAIGSGKRILVVGFLRWWLEYAAAIGLMLHGLGHRAELAYVPYKDWHTAIPRFDRRRQSELIRRTLSPAQDILTLHDLSRPSPGLPGALREEIGELTLIDVQYSRQRETLDLSPGGEDVELYQLRLARNTEAAASVYQLLRSHAFDQVIIPNGSIFEFGAVFRTARHLGVPAVSFEFGEQKERIWLAQNSEVMLQDTGRLWQERGDLPLTGEEEEAVHELYAARKGGMLWKNFDRQWQPGGQKGGDAVREQLGLDPARPVALLCTNVVGDSLALGRQLFTDGMADWLALTARFFAENPQVQLVVRVHPGELRSVGDPSVDIIQRTLPDIPENIHVIPPDAPVNTYDLIQIADLGLVYTTTVGMEMAMIGVPVMVGARTHYRGRGFTIDPGDREEYLSYLQDFVNGTNAFSMDADRSRLAWRYAYRFFFEFALPFPWHIVHFMSDIQACPIAQVCSEEGRRRYRKALEVFSGEPLEYGSSELSR